MNRRPRSLEVPGVSHGAAPIPLGARVGNAIYSSGIPGIDRTTGKLGEDAASQARFAFDNMRLMLEAGGARLEDVVRMTVYLKDNAARDHINEQWLECFSRPPRPASAPHADVRPAGRHASAARGRRRPCSILSHPTRTLE